MPDQAAEFRAAPHFMDPWGLAAAALVLGLAGLVSSRLARVAARPGGTRRRLLALGSLWGLAMGVLPVLASCAGARGQGSLMAMAIALFCPGSFLLASPTGSPFRAGGAPWPAGQRLRHVVLAAGLTCGAVLSFVVAAVVAVAALGGPLFDVGLEAVAPGRPAFPADRGAPAH